jgi:hypothetical protein
MITLVITWISRNLHCMARGKKPGSPKTGGRQPGSVNKKSTEAKRIAERLGVDPLEVLLLITKGDWKALGYTSQGVTKALKDGGTIEEDRISLGDRLNAAKEAAKYCYPQLKAVEHSGEIDTSLAERMRRAEERLKEDE